MKTLLLIPILIALSACATTQQVQQVLGAPDQVQAEVTALGAAAKIFIPASDTSQVHQFASALAGCTTINSTILLGLIPHVTNPKTDALIQASAAFVSLALSRYSSGDLTALGYAHAAGNGLLANF